MIFNGAGKWGDGHTQSMPAGRDVRRQRRRASLAALALEADRREGVAPAQPSPAQRPPASPERTFLAAAFLAPP